MLKNPSMDELQMNVATLGLTTSRSQPLADQGPSQTYGLPRTLSHLWLIEDPLKPLSYQGPSQTSGLSWTLSNLRIIKDPL
ncbi:hypothetical protein HOLleu_29939 [Holothuria leucospilota]|uniref:Uncharacterized protein n=1 Tax=Holothuria leucospilota TaxID=206669 RepID=A0A9Q1BJQ1_HOLLE|nr:hypothetical protein HOLleu_29939 [Holothuria leucospilota]